MIKTFNKLYRVLFKRIFDFILSCLLILLLSPVFILIGIIALINHGWPVLFVQRRPGYNGRIFNIYKFRTMLNSRDSDGKLLPDNKRITRFGRFLRSSSLDELPELFNVLKGDMSFVGPRPLLVEYLPLYNKKQARRHEVRPGITGWAQINGRNAISWEEKFKFDIFYVDKVSLLFDIKIFILTVLSVLKRKDINSSSDDTMPPFTGSKE